MKSSWRRASGKTTGDVIPVSIELVHLSVPTSVPRSGQLESARRPLAWPSSRFTPNLINLVAELLVPCVNTGQITCSVHQFVCARARVLAPWLVSGQVKSSLELIQ